MYRTIKKRRIQIVALLLLIVVGGFAVYDVALARHSNLPIFTPGAMTPRGAAGAAAAGAGASATAGAVAGTLASYFGTGLSIYGILLLLSSLFSYLITFAASILNAAFVHATDAGWYYSDAIIKGWELARDFANIWFILILLIIAIATILRVESYQAKKTLGNIILVAILINFSLPVVRFIIDSANVITFQFVKAICLPTKDTNTGKQACNMSGSIVNAIKLQGIMNTARQDAAAGAKAGNPIGYEGISDTETASVLAPEAHAAGAGNLLKAGTKKILPWLKNLGKEIAPSIIGIAAIEAVITGDGVLGVAVQPFVRLAVTDIALGATAFVLLSIAILMLLRTISLLFIIVTAPLGFLFSVFPGTATYGKMWWDHLWKQSFFAPMMAFFLWFSIKFMSEIDQALNATGNYDIVLTDPSNPRAIFFVTYIVMLFGCLYIAKKMGAIGADLAVKWFEKGGSLLAGYVGGFAARSIVAPLGAAATRAGLPQALGRITPALGVGAAGVTGWLSTRGGADKAAAAKAALGLSMAPSQRADYFKKLDLASKQAMLEKIKPEERPAFMASLTPDQRKVAENIMRSHAFTPEERAKFDLESWKRLAKTDQVKGFMGLNDEAKEQVLRNMNEDEKARFLDEMGAINPAAKAAALALLGSKLAPSDMTKLNVASWKRLSEKDRQKAFFGMQQDMQEQILRSMSDDERAKFTSDLANTNRLAAREAEAIINSPRFTADEQKKFKDAQNKLTLRTDELDGKLASEMNKMYGTGSAVEVDAVKGMFKVMSASQRRILLENWAGDASKLQKMQEWVQKMNAEDQEKFYNDTLKRTSNDTLGAYLGATSDTGVHERILSSVSAEQQAYLFDRWNTDRATNPESGDRFDTLDRVVKTSSADVQRKYYKEIAQKINEKPVAEIKKMYANLPLEVATSVIRDRKIDDTMDLINALDETNTSDKATLDVIMQDIESAGKREQYIKKVNPIHKVKYFDGIDPAADPIQFEREITAKVKRMSPKDYVQRIDESTLQNKTSREFVLGGSSLNQLVALMDTPRKMQILKDAITDGGTKTNIDDIARRFEREYKNKELGKKITELRKKVKTKTLSPIDRQFIDQLGLT